MKKYLILSLLIAFSVALVSCGSENNSSSSETAPYEDTGFAMGTVVNQTIYSEDENITKEIINLLTETENNWISWRAEDSDIAKVNMNAGKNKPTEISEKTSKYISNALKVADDSKGAFDPTIGKLTRLWDFDNSKNEIPDDKDIKSMLKDINYKDIKLEGNRISIKKHSSIDLGAAGKGIGCDEIETYLNSRDDVKGALVNVGGSSVFTYGEKNTQEPWKVAILNPRDENDFLGAISVQGNNHISTSGDYERYFEKDDKRYHHILDPHTGYPADKGLMSVTVVTNNGTISDALSTACFVLGRDNSQSLLEKYEAEAIFVDREKNVYVTDGIKEKFELMADGYKQI